ncbi:hypothetical protein T03_6451 [Trichinella britovi]|uniref:Secreted protein n=1 Tax=Trichinella britovi TaxID=45882 RepID=A0A0V0Z0R6_TRIBR|nr:hypothetical protein T03_6451 [Trichinella britovi]
MNFTENHTCLSLFLSWSVAEGAAHLCTVCVKRNDRRMMCMQLRTAGRHLVRLSEFSRVDAEKVK